MIIALSYGGKKYFPDIEFWGQMDKKDFFSDPGRVKNWNEMKP